VSPEISTHGDDRRHWLNDDWWLVLPAAQTFSKVRPSPIASIGGGVYVSAGTFTKTGGIVYGDTDHTAGNGNATDNTATNTSNPGTNGHAIFYAPASSYYYRNETLADDASGNISATDTLPAESGDVLNNWTKR
jgi:hypothetical protein